MKFKIILPLILLIISSFKGYASASSEIATIEAALKAHPSHRTLIVGCGKKPDAWKSSSGDRGQFNEWEAKEIDGDHSHEGCLTLAEMDTVQPDILLDWTKPVPESMHGKFKVVYLEKLPPCVLAQVICMQNAFHCLQAEGVVYLDHQFQQKLGTDYTLADPFTMTIPPFSAAALQEITKLETLEAAFTDKFYQTSGLTRTAPINREDFEKLLAEKPDLAKLNALTFRLRKQIQDLRVAEISAQRAEAYKLLRKPANEEVKKYVKGFGFKTVTVQELKEPNPFNGRMRSTLVRAEGP